MASYRIEWKRSASKELKKLDKPVIPRIMKLVESLAENPHPPGSRKITGSQNAFRVRTGNYRVIYSVFEDVLTIQIVRIAHRKEVYRKI